jgi:hypothetical protein
MSEKDSAVYQLMNVLLLSSAFLNLWYGLHPDLVYGEIGELYFGKAADGHFIPVSYKNESGEEIQALLVSSADAAGKGHLLALQSLALDFERNYSTIFNPMLKSIELQISP